MRFLGNAGFPSKFTIELEFLKFLKIVSQRKYHIKSSLYIFINLGMVMEP